MSKRALKEYVSELPKKELELQLLDLYDRFPLVKEYYNFIFNPKEDKLIQDAKVKISNEYYPLKRKRARLRRSIAQKFIKHFLKLGVEAHLVADVMLYNIEIAQSFSSEKKVADTFYKSMHNSFDQAVVYISQNGLLADFKNRVVTIYNEAEKQDWLNFEDFSRTLDKIE
ncbi:hypothetical protein KO500_07310 [Cellulophaga baltica]|uniref:DUF6155 family protein n=1 Tax=Cellulophaga TaxID=104264 RepID=UPI001C07B468|nr:MULTISPECIES: DUF6155 family protein [Cellulophaga]MBU2996236.1 hypothetical protein [Cellulophaga baltica]MDO6767631.1 DUF6155 family protein [Cellulophaga sp. 1_MG-2023]